MIQIIANIDGERWNTKNSSTQLVFFLIYKSGFELQKFLEYKKYKKTNILKTRLSEISFL